MNLTQILGCGLCTALVLTAECADPASALSQGSPHSAAGAETQRLSLAEAQEIAVGRNWDLLAARAGVDAAMAQRIVAREYPNPTLSVSTSKINVDHHPNSTVAGNGVWDRSYDTIVAFNQLFEVGGKRRSRKLSAQAGYEAARAEFLDAARTLKLGVTRAYIAAVFSAENARILEQSAATLRQEATIADVRLKAGEISESDKSQIEISAARFELDAKAARAAAAQATIALEVLLGSAHPKGDTVLSDLLESLASSPPSPKADLSGSFRPDVLASAALLRRSEADLQLQKANRIPDPTALAQYEHEPPDAPNSIGFGVSLPLPFWNRNRGNIQAAEAARDQARLAYDKARAQAVADIASARVAYLDAAQRWERYREHIRPQSDRVTRTLAYSYQKGGASILDMLIAQRNDNEVRLAAIQAASDTALASAALEAATQETQPAQLKK